MESKQYDKDMYEVFFDNMEGWSYCTVKKGETSRNKVFETPQEAKAYVKEMNRKIDLTAVWERREKRAAEYAALYA